MTLILVNRIYIFFFTNFIIILLYPRLNLRIDIDKSLLIDYIMYNRHTIYNPIS